MTRTDERLSDSSEVGTCAIMEGENGRDVSDGAIIDGVMLLSKLSVDGMSVSAWGGPQVSPFSCSIE